MKISAIIPAGGSGNRFGGGRPKQFHEINGIPLIIHTLQKFQSSDCIASIVISINNNWREYMLELADKFGLSKVKEIVGGGGTRQQSVANALKSDYILMSDIILVHDAVRPLVSAELIAIVIENAKETGAAIPALPPVDTIKEVDSNGFVVNTLDRSTLRCVQTPQGFKKDILIEAYKKAAAAGYEGTDDASLVEFAGFAVKVVDGESSNIKVTTSDDINISDYTST